MNNQQGKIDTTSVRVQILKIKEYIKLLHRELTEKYQSIILENTIRNTINEIDIITSSIKSNKLDLALTIDDESIAERAAKIAIKSRDISRHFRRSAYSKLSIETSHLLIEQVNLLEKTLENFNNTENKYPTNDLTDKASKNLRKLTSNLQEFDVKLEALDTDLKKTFSENSTTINRLSEDISVLEQRAAIELGKITKSHDEVIKEINQKSSQIDELLGTTSTRSISIDYDRSAQDEKLMADRLRYGSLFCMVLIGAMLGYTFWETTSTEFNWQKSIFRITLTFLLSVPAAYLARESSKHREQQYQHLQTSLDLKAIPPFIASLPVDEQNTFKLAIANKIFASREQKNDLDSYPINMQEIIMALLKKIEDIPSKKEKLSTEDAQPK